MLHDMRCRKHCRRDGVSGKLRDLVEAVRQGGTSLGL
jgi:hypothetical protein